MGPPTLRGDTAFCRARDITHSGNMEITLAGAPSPISNGNGKPTVGNNSDGATIDNRVSSRRHVIKSIETVRPPPQERIWWLKWMRNREIFIRNCSLVPLLSLYGFNYRFTPRSLPRLTLSHLSFLTFPVGSVSNNGIEMLRLSWVPNDWFQAAEFGNLTLAPKSL